MIKEHVQKLKNAYIQLRVYIQHLPYCQVHNTEFCNCGLRESRKEFVDCAQKLEKFSLLEIDKNLLDKINTLINKNIIESLKEKKLLDQRLEEEDFYVADVFKRSRKMRTEFISELKKIINEDTKIQ